MRLRNLKNFHVKKWVNFSFFNAHIQCPFTYLRKKVGMLNKVFSIFLNNDMSNTEYYLVKLFIKDSKDIDRRDQ